MQVRITVENSESTELLLHCLSMLFSGVYFLNKNLQCTAHGWIQMGGGGEGGGQGVQTPLPEK